MLQDIFIWMFTLVGLMNFFHLGLYIAGANIYDTLRITKERKAKKQPKGKAFRPHVTVLIPAHNEQMGVIRTIESVRASTYKNLSIVVIDDASTDDTADLVRRYIMENSVKTRARIVRKNGTLTREFRRIDPGMQPLRLLALEKNGGKAAGLNYALHRAVKGGLTMTLDADSMLQPEAIANSVRYFKDPGVVGVGANVQIQEQHTILGLLQKFEHMIGYRSKKFYTVTNSEFIIGGVGSMYRYDVLKRVGFYDTDTVTEDIGLSMKIVALGNRAQRIIYGADVVASTEGVQTYKALFKQRYRWKLGNLQNLLKYRALFGSRDHKYSRMLTFYRIPMAFIGEVILMMQPFFLAYVVYLSVIYQTFGLLAGSYLTITVFVLWNLWPDENHGFWHKVRLSLYAPAMYFCFFIMDAVQISAIFRCLINARQLTDKRDRSGTWVSPERASTVIAQTA
ncbi:MAG TPA: glycosyltransferase family 2 protein [Candidatus Saccharimonadales bacterium]|nr:glycosyltransferase family 2 protein [Candidatus Saccharimonadales bacterium]